jgi:hypothetical protein
MFAMTPDAPVNQPKPSQGAQRYLTGQPPACRGQGSSSLAATRPRELLRDPAPIDPAAKYADGHQIPY